MLVSNFLCVDHLGQAVLLVTRGDVIHVNLLLVLVLVNDQWSSCISFSLLAILIRSLTLTSLILETLNSLYTCNTLINQSLASSCLPILLSSAP